MQIKNKKIMVIFWCAILGVLSGCGNKDADNVNRGGDGEIGDQSLHKDFEIIKNEQLAINEAKCIGCGKCARIAPNNFAMKAGERKAEIVSIDPSSQKDIDRAVDVCPTNAITQ
jgi:ferredoxin